MYKLLVVEDDERVVTALRLVLQRTGHEVVAVPSVAAALKRLNWGGPVDLVLTDHSLPPMRGRDVTRALRRAAPYTPILLMSGYALDMLEAEHEGLVDGFIAKPFDPSALMGAINKALAEAMILKAA